MLKLSDLAQRPDFKLGPLEISPARRRVVGPAGEAQVEPLIMQLFLLLLDARGRVVTRAELFDALWGGAMVGDDSLNRAVRMVRRIVAETGPGLLEVETVPRTGYRITGDIVGPAPDAEVNASSPPSRRNLLIGAGVLTAGIGGVALLRTNGREERTFGELMAKGEDVLDYGDPPISASRYFRDAVGLRPGSAHARGLLATSRALDADYGRPAEISAAVIDAEREARAALSIAPGEPNARIALTMLQRSTLDLANNEDRIRDILAHDPKNIRAMRELWDLLICVGRGRDALAMVERALAVKPLAAANNYPRAQLLWILGRNQEADRVIDLALQYWPSHRFVRFARFILLAFTDRPRAALAMLDGRNTAPQAYSPKAIALWRVSLAALDRRTPATISAARAANIASAKENLGLASQAVIVLSALGDVDAAFEVVNQLFVIPAAHSTGHGSAGSSESVSSMAWRFAPWLFIPPTAPMRTDARFKTLCDGIGLTDYWRKRGVGPDPFLFKA